MKVCITTATTEGEPRLDPRFGRSPWFTFVDTESGAREVEENERAGGARGVGAQVAQYVAERGVDAVITGQVGPSAFQVLEAAGIAAYTTDAATVAEALDAFRAGTLVRVGAATTHAHHGGSHR